jgi:hypothetical protein
VERFAFANALGCFFNGRGDEAAIDRARCGGEGGD